MGYRIADVAKMTGLSAYTLRYYEKEGLLPFVERTASGIRDFNEQDLEWITIITCLKNTGMPIRDIRTFLQWCAEGDSTLDQRLAMFTEHKKRAEKKLRELERSMERINHKIWYYTKAVQAGTEAIHRKGSCGSPQDISGNDRK